MKCGKCKEEGVDVAHVRNCYGVKSSGYVVEGPDPFTEANEHDLNKGEHEVNRVGQFTMRRQPSAAAQRGQRPAPIPEEDRVYLRVPFAEKDVAKRQFGAMFHGETKQWYVKKSADFDEMPKHWLPNPTLEDGIYHFIANVGEPDDVGSFYMVYHTVHGANQQVAKKLFFSHHPEDHEDEELRGKPKGDWTYIGKAPLRFLRPEMLLPKERQAELGIVYGFCVRCGRTLTAEDSKEIGMGPICRNK